MTEKDNPSMRRLDNPNDWVRFEVETGLQTPATTVLPELVQNASMPPDSKLPSTLRELAFKNAITVRDDPDFDTDVARLIQSVRGRTVPTGWLTIAAIVLLLVMVGALLLSNRGKDGSLTAIDTTLTLSPTLTDEQTNIAILAENTLIAETAIARTTDEPLSPIDTATTEHPCQAKIVIRNKTVGSSSFLYVVRKDPSPDSELQNPIVQGKSVVVLEQAILSAIESYGTVWYLIADFNMDVLGWIPSEYLTFNTTSVCENLG